MAAELGCLIWMSVMEFQDNRDRWQDLITRGKMDIMIVIGVKFRVSVRVL